MPTINVWNIKFDLLSKAEIVDLVQHMLDEGRRGIHLTGVNPETVVDAQDKIWAPVWKRCMKHCEKGAHSIVHMQSSVLAAM